MNERADLRYERAVRMKTFGTANGGDFAAGSIATALFAENKQLVDDVDTAKADQRRSADTGKEILVDALRLDMKNITRTARAIALKEPGFADGYRMPDSPGEGVLLTAGDAFVKGLAVAGVPDKFIAREMDPGFVQHLKDDLKAIRDYKGGAEGEREDSVEATAAIARLVLRSTEIAEELTAIMHNKYGRSNPDKLRAWISAAHLERMPHRAKTATGSSSPATGNASTGSASNPA